MSNYLKSGDYIGGSPFLNQVADSVASGQPDMLGVLGSAYGGGLNDGDYLRLSDAEALALSNTSVGTLYGGEYRRVLLKAGITGGGNTGFFLGSLVFWDVLNTGVSLYQVTNVEATDPGLVAGIVINATDSSGSPLSGKYVWIQTSGVASVKFRGTLTATASPAAGDSIFAALAGAGADNAKADDLQLSTAAAFKTNIIGGFIGIAVDAPTNGGLKRVMLKGLSLERP